MYSHYYTGRQAELLETDRGAREVSGGRVVEEEKEGEGGGGRGGRGEKLIRFAGVGAPAPRGITPGVRARGGGRGGGGGGY